MDKLEHNSETSSDNIAENAQDPVYWMIPCSMIQSSHFAQTLKLSLVHVSH